MGPIVGYVRVSTTKQAREGDSPEAQQERIRSWARERKIDPETIHWFVDRGISGHRADNRPGLQSALDLVTKTRGTLAFYSLSRLARSVSDAVSISQRLATADAHMISMTEPLDTSSPTGKLIYGIFALFAEFERDLAVERTQSVVDYKRGKNERIGQIPYGFSLAADGKTVEENFKEQAVIKAIVEMREQGSSLQVIASKLAVAKIRPKNGGDRWSPSSIATILLRVHHDARQAPLPCHQ